MWLSCYPSSYPYRFNIMPAGVGDEETAPFLTESPPSSPTSIVTIPYQPLDQNDSINGDNSSSSRSHGSEWTMSQSARRLYVSHTLSTWNSRVFEFGSVLYLASIFPGTLMPLAVIRWFEPLLLLRYRLGLEIILTVMIVSRRWGFRLVCSSGCLRYLNWHW